MQKKAKAGEKLKIAGKLVIVTLLSAIGSGCVFTNPFWGQIIEGRSNSIPVQTWVTVTNPVYLYCSKANSHGSPYDGFKYLETVYPDTAPHYDSDGEVIYNASTKIKVPESCWHRHDYGDAGFSTAIRARQYVSGKWKNFLVFTRKGLACMGEANGLEASWYAWLKKGCNATNSSGGGLTYVFVKSK